MAKTKTSLRCSKCGYLSQKWMGKCPECGEWDTFVEEIFQEEVKARRGTLSSGSPQLLSEIHDISNERQSSGIGEFDRVLGGGIVAGSLVLLGGEPGVGKSTLLLQVLEQVAREKKVLLVLGEESTAQVKMRAKRLGALSSGLYLLSETNIEVLEEHISKIKPSLVAIDSIQTVFLGEIPSPPGSVGQIKEVTSYLLQIAKGRNVPIFIVGHVTKEGAIAGPRLLEHMVDTVLYFEGDTRLPFKIIRAVKNRFGSTNEIGVFEMTSAGLKEVSNPSQVFLSKVKNKVAGAITIPTLEGTRCVLVELQALVTSSPFAVPRRLVSGLEYNRVLLTLAVLEKRASLKLSAKDVFLNVAGGVKVVETAADLGVALAVFSAYKELEVPREVVAFGEVGLAGEVRFVSQLELRLKEAKKLGFKKAIIPCQDIKLEKSLAEMEICQVNTVKEAISLL